MKLNIRFLGGAKEVGRSAILINEEILLDYGIKPTDPPAYPLNGLRPKALIISHGHLDHCGLAPNLMDLKPEIYSTPLTAKLSVLLAKDTLRIAENKGYSMPYYSEEIHEFERSVRIMDYKQEFHTLGYTACFYDAGHIPGSASVYIEKHHESLFYTGDINTIQTELLRGADTEYPESGTLVIEGTYFGRNHTPRKILEKRFIQSIKETLDNGGKAIIPAFSIGRTQEIMLILKKHGLDAYVDGMGVDVFNLLKRSPDNIRNLDELKKIFIKTNIIKPEQRKTIIKDAVIIVTSAGMLNGGPVLYYISKIHDDPRSKIHLTGYQVEGTNGRKAIENRYIEDRNNIIKLKCKIELFDFSAHCDDTQLKNIVKKFCDNGTHTVLPVHGDHAEEFAEWIAEDIGVRATAPSNGETVYI